MASPHAQAKLPLDPSQRRHEIKLASSGGGSKND